MKISIKGKPKQLKAIFGELLNKPTLQTHTPESVAQIESTEKEAEKPFIGDADWFEKEMIDQCKALGLEVGDYDDTLQSRKIGEFDFAIDKTSGIFALTVPYNVERPEGKSAYYLKTPQNKHQVQALLFMFGFIK